VRVFGLRRAKAAVLDGSRSHPLSTVKAKATRSTHGYTSKHRYYEKKDTRDGSSPRGGKGPTEIWLGIKVERNREEDDSRQGIVYISIVI
jgi:hypothetical protein